MELKVCDALCGSGKTSACIRMMNERKDTRFIFVTQFLSEVERIKSKCACRGFVAPEDYNESHRSKLRDVRQLLRDKCNIATTHALFTSCTEEIKQLVRDGQYVLILDETVDIFHMSDLKTCDIKMLLQHNIIEDRDGHIEWVYKEYESDDRDGDGKFSQEVLLAKSKNLLRYEDEYFFWAIPPDLFSCFKEAYVLTYMFFAQGLRCFFDLYGLKYEYIGTKYEDDAYSFCPAEEMDRKRDLRSKIHILDHKKLNEVGEGRSDLSFSSYALLKHKDKELMPEKLRKNLVNLFRNVYRAKADDVMWTTFKDFRERMSSRGYANSFVTYNKRASNEYAHKHYLAYCVNNFMRPWETAYYKDHNVEIDQDSYALSILVQWMFRSAIRNGEEIWIYIPSARMRSLLRQWLDNLANGEDLKPVKFTETRKRRTKKTKEGSEANAEELREVPVGT